MSAPLAGRCAVVTGASRGIGRAIARALAAAGARCYAVTQPPGVNVDELRLSAT